MWLHTHPRLDDAETLPGTDDAVVDDTRRARATVTIRELESVPRPTSPVHVSPEVLTRVLTDLATAVHGHTPMRQYQVITDVARNWQLPPAAVLALARDAGTMIAKTTHQPPAPLPGEPNLNRLQYADLGLAAEILLARARLAWNTTHSDRLISLRGSASAVILLGEWRSEFKVGRSSFAARTMYPSHVSPLGHPVAASYLR